MSKSETITPFTPLTPLGDQTTAPVCIDGVCELPTTEQPETADNQETT